MAEDQGSDLREYYKADLGPRPPFRCSSQICAPRLKTRLSKAVSRFWTRFQVLCSVLFSVPGAAVLFVLLFPQVSFPQACRP